MKILNYVITFFWDNSQQKKVTLNGVIELQDGEDPEKKIKEYYKNEYNIREHQIIKIEI